MSVLSHSGFFSIPEAAFPSILEALNLSKPFQIHLPLKLPRQESRPVRTNEILSRPILLFAAVLVELWPFLSYTNSKSGQRFFPHVSDKIF